MSSESHSSDTPEACPVDHKTRATWLARSAQPQRASAPSSPSPLPAGESCDSSSIDQTIPSSSPSIPLPTLLRPLSHERETSTIPRATDRSSPSAPTSAPARAANNEQETGQDRRSGNWIYPSEKMFFEAMRRKSYDPQAEDMRTIVPIHNAVNERAWREIREWERGRGAESCGGPRLLSFCGLSTSLTPKARINSLLGYQLPFDRHDWVIDRCGTRVEYVIDFYAGRDDGKSGKSLNFYLDVRPKLNSWEGWKMRLGRPVGL